MRSPVEPPSRRSDSPLASVRIHKRDGRMQEERTYPEAPIRDEHEGRRDPMKQGTPPGSPAPSLA